jgi:hypothetical protein
LRWVQVQVQKNDTMKHTGLGTAAGYVSIVASVGTTENPLEEKKRKRVDQCPPTNPPPSGPSF